MRSPGKGAPRAALCCAGLALALVLIGCDRPPVLTADQTLHLLDHLDAATVIGSDTPTDLPEPVEWRFDEPQPDWRPATPRRDGMETVEPIQLDDALRLPFTSGMSNPGGWRAGAIYVDLPDWDIDDWGFVEISARTVGSFANIGLNFNYNEEGHGGGSFPFYSAGDAGPLESDGTVQTYRLSLNWEDVEGSVQGRVGFPGPWTHLAVWATCADEQGEAALEILSIKVMPVEAGFAGERTGLRESTSGIGPGRYLFAHTPGRIEFPVRVPFAGRLDVGLGILREASSVTFRIAASARGEAEAVLLEETYTDDTGWGRRVLDLSGFAEKTVTLALETDAGRPGSVAFWGEPTITGIRDEYRPKTYPGQEDELLDLDATERIIEEAFQRSQVMDFAGMLTDVYGPRLHGSSNLLHAGEWIVETLSEWGVRSARMERLDVLDRGWENERFYAHVISPAPYPVIGYPLAWTPGTDGWVIGQAVIVQAESEQDLERYRGTLQGKFVLTQPPPTLTQGFHENPPPARYSDEVLWLTSENELSPWRNTGWQDKWPPGISWNPAPGLNQFFLEEGVAASIGYSQEEGGMVSVEGPSPERGDLWPPTAILAYEHYGRIWRNLQRGIPVELEMRIENRSSEEPRSIFNVLAEIPGTAKADELVVFGAHLDSWHAGTGATDNASGVSVMMEAMRILKTLELPMRRTVQIALWAGEEHGMIGSRAYVDQHVRSGQAKVSVYYNLDHGPGRIRGARLMDNQALAPIFARWMEPFHYLGMTTLNPGTGGSSDHMRFHRVNVPCSDFIQDPMFPEGHTNMDTYERILEDDLKQAVAVVASFVYHAANREEMLPRIQAPSGPG